MRFLLHGLAIACAASSSCTGDDQCSSSEDATDSGWAMIQRKQQIVKNHNLATEEEANPNFAHLGIKDGHDWTTASCFKGWHVTGGGCAAETDPFSYRWSAPVGNPPHAWKCGGNGTTKKVEVYCTKDFPTMVVSSNGGDWVETHCPSGYKVTGGGCDARASPFKFQASEPVGTTGWRCGGHGGAKTVWAICTNSPRPIYHVSKEGGDWTQVSCHAGDQAIAGGCNALAKPFYMQENNGRGNSWMCGGQGGKKKATVICVAPTPAPTPMPSLAPTLLPTPMPSPVPTAEPTVAPTEEPTLQKCSECVLQFNGLDVSPLDGGDEFKFLEKTKFRFKNVCANGPSADLILTVRNWNTKPSKTKVVGDYLQFNIKDGSEPQLKFDFVKPGTDSDYVVLSKMYLSILDLDNGPTQTEYVGISSNAATNKWVGSNIVPTDGKPGYYDETIGGGAVGDASDNPTAGSKITAEMAKNSVALLFENAPTFQFYLGVKSTGTSVAGRSVFLGGRTSLVTDKLSCD